MTQDLRPAVVLLSEQLRGPLDARCICRNIKQHAVLSGTTKVVVLGPAAREEEAPVRQDARADAYLLKPFSPLQLLRKLDDAMGRLSVR